MIFDWHTHLDLFPQPMIAVQQASLQTTGCLSVTTSPRAWMMAKKRFAPYQNIKVALGLHPEIVITKKDELSLFNEISQATDFIGEIGIDGKATTRDLQTTIFQGIIDTLTKQTGKTISIHSRMAEDDVLAILTAKCKSNNIILHWFSGSLAKAEMAIDRGYFFSINPAMCKTKKGIEIIKTIPLQKILLESDAPFSYVSEVQVVPWNLERVLNNISIIKSIEKKELIQIISKTTASILNKSKQ